MIGKLLLTLTTVTLVSASAFGNFYTSFTEGRKAAAKKQYQTALAKYQEALGKTSIPGQKYQVLYAMAGLQQKQKAWQKAEALFAQIINDKTIPANNRMSAQISLGDCKLKQKNIKAAVAEYQKAAAYGIVNSESRYAMLACGSLLQQLGRYDEAQKCYKQIIDDPKTDFIRKVRAQNGMGKLLYNMKKYKEAVEVLSAVIADPKVQGTLRADALTAAARSQYRLKDYKNAVKNSTAIIEMKNIPAYFKASAYMQMISIQAWNLRDYKQAKKLLDDFEKMPGVTASQKKWIQNVRADVKKAEYTI